MPRALAVATGVMTPIGLLAKIGNSHTFAMSFKMNKLTIRAAQPRDAEPLTTFAKSSFVATYEAYNSREDLAEYLSKNFTLSRFQKLLDSDQARLLIAEYAGHCIGYAQLSAERVPEVLAGRQVIELERLYLDATLHGHGIAKKLLSAACQTAVTMGGRQLWLGVWEHNARAIAFYKKCDFRQVGEIGFWFGSSRQNDFILVLDLPEKLQVAS